jgi:hypothetical protein
MRRHAACRALRAKSRLGPEDKEADSPHLEQPPLDQVPNLHGRVRTGRPEVRAIWQHSDWPVPWRTYPDLLNRKPDTDPKSYQFEIPEQQQFAGSATEEFVDMVGSWQDSFDHPEPDAEGRSPRPKPVLRMMPPGSNDPRSERADTPGGSPPAAA